MKSLKFSGIVVTLLLSSGIAGAQSTPSNGPTLQTPPNTSPSASTPPASTVATNLTLSEAISAAMKRNYTTRTSANNVDRSRLEVQRSNDNLLPSVSAS